MKFKCRTWYCGKYYYGHVVDEDEEGVTFCENSYGDYMDVRPQDVERLIGYDCDGKEVYEGDIVIGAGQEFTAELWAMGVNAVDADALEGGLFNFKLKDEK